ncbi:hypothetical protein HALO32_01133 [Halomonas lysinitropha]|uniref:Uncharacterized protein n=1 Tax=Halomonas lysinitropha TaxID=2607506 RepID=A0A5K1I4B6_9GAMM|nr:hypothetical protein HALO32_01133 [Halomonas lysinitropha]
MAGTERKTGALRPRSYRLTLYRSIHSVPKYFS